MTSRQLNKMTAARLEHITKIGVEDFGAMPDSLDDPDILRLENLDTDLRPPGSALWATKDAIDRDDVTSYVASFLDGIRF